MSRTAPRTKERAAARLAAHLVEHGHDPAPVLRKAGIAPELLASPRGRVSSGMAGAYGAVGLTRLPLVRRRSHRR